MSDNTNNRIRYENMAVLRADMIGHREATKHATQLQIAQLIDDFQEKAETLLSKFSEYRIKFDKDGILARFKRVPDAVFYAQAFGRKWSETSEIKLRFVISFGEHCVSQRDEITSDCVDLLYEFAKQVDEPKIVGTEAVVEISDKAIFHWKKWRVPRDFPKDRIKPRQLWQLYRVDEYQLPSIKELTEAKKPDGPDLELAEKLFSEALSYIGTENENSDRQALLFELAIKYGKVDATAFFNFAYNLGSQGKHNEACNKYAEAVRLKPDFPLAYNNWGAELSILGEHDKACEKYAEAIKQESDFALAYNNWGISLSNLNRFEEAAEKFRKAVELKPDYFEAYNDWGNALFSLKRYEEAKEKYEEAVKLKSDYYDAYYNWGNALFNLGRYVDACEKYSRIVTSHTTYFDAINNWGNALSKLGRFAEALEKSNLAVRLRPADQTWNAVKGEMEYYCGMNAEAVRSLSKAIGLDSKLHNEAAPHIILAAALMKTGKRMAAIRELQTQVNQCIGSFEVDRPDLVLAAFDKYKEEPNLAPLLANVREKLRLWEAAQNAVATKPTKS